MFAKVLLLQYNIFNQSRKKDKIMAKETIVTDAALLTAADHGDKVREIRFDPKADPYTWVRPAGRIIPANANKPKK